MNKFKSLHLSVFHSFVVLWCVFAWWNRVRNSTGCILGYCRCNSMYGQWLSVFGRLSLLWCGRLVSWSERPGMTVLFDILTPLWIRSRILIFRCAWNSSSLDFLSIISVSFMYLIHRRGRRVPRALASNCFMVLFPTRPESRDPISVVPICLHVFPSNYSYVSKHKSTRFNMAFVGIIVLSRRLGSFSIRFQIPSNASSVGMFVNNHATANEIIISSVFNLRP